MGVVRGGDYYMQKYEKYRRIMAEERDFQKDQEKLHKKHEEIREDQVIVEKANTVKFLLSFLRGLLKTLFSAAFILLAAAGILALVYPQPRQELLLVIQNIASEIRTLVI